MLVQNDRVTWPFFGRDLARAPFPLAIPEEKGKDTVRIFVFGESAAFGDPQPEFGLGRMLEALLSGRYRGVRFEIVNAAMTGINSHAIVRIARDCARRQGDLWVVYMGNNEVVGPYGAGTVFGSRTPGLTLVRTTLALRETRIGQLFVALSRRFSRPSPENREWGGMQMFLNHRVRHDAPEMAVVYSHFERNLVDLIAAAQRGGAKVITGTVVSNLKECPPFGSLHRPGLRPAELEEWNRLFEQAREAQRNARFEEATMFLTRASRIDDTFAEMHYLWGECCLQLGQDTQAAERFARSRDLDVLRFRADSQINRIIARVAATGSMGDVRLLDTQALLARQSPRGIVGSELLYEHVHLNFRGNYLLALAFAENIAAMLPSLGASSSPWPTLEDCADRLGWTPRNRRIGLMAMTARMGEPPFTTQLNHDATVGKRRKELEELRAAVAPAGLRAVIAEYQSALKRAPQDWVLLKELSLAQQEAGDFAGAAESMRQVLELMPHFAVGWQELGRNLVELKRNDEAAAAFGQALTLNPDSVPALASLAQTVAKLGRTDQAIALYERALRIKPYWSPAHLELGKLLQTVGRTDAAERHFKRALESRAFTPAALRTLAAFCFDQGWLDAACTNFADAVRLDPADPATRVNLGITLGALGRHAEAEAQFAEALRLDPDLAEAHVRLGFEVGRRGRDAEAVEHFQRAVQLKPEMIEARVNLGVALMNQQREDEALGQFREVLRQQPANPVALQHVRKLTSRVR